MDRAVQRAILLKAIMEAMGKPRSLTQENFYRNIQEERFKGRWCRFNASSDLLKDGLAEYVKTVGALLEENRNLIPEDPLWKAIVEFALRDDDSVNTLPKALGDLQHWRLSDPFRSSSERRYITRDMGGCWYIFRLTSKGTSDRLVTVSFLNIRPEFYYEKNPSRSIEFSLISRADRGDDPLVKVNGICRHEGLQLHFVGVLAKRSAQPTAMVLHYDDGDGREVHRPSSKGLLFTTNSNRDQIAAPVVATYIEGSADWRGDIYDAEKIKLIKQLGHHKASELSFMPDWVYPHLLDRSKNELVYESQ